MLWSETFVGSELHSFVLGATVIRFVYWHGGRKFLGAKVPGSESSIYGTFALGSESTWERKFHNSFRYRMTQQ